MMSDFDLETLSLSNTERVQNKKTTPKKNKTHQRGLFLKGPIQLSWLSKASKLSGKTLEVGIVIWFYAGLKKNHTVQLSNGILNTFGVDRHAKYRAIKQLVAEKLIEVNQITGRSPIVTLIETVQTNDDSK